MVMFADDAFSNPIFYFAKPVSSTPPGSPQTNLGFPTVKAVESAESFSLLGALLRDAT